MLSCCVGPGFIFADNALLLTRWIGATDKALGNKEGWRKSIEFKSQDQGAATTVFAAFSPDLKGECPSMIIWRADRLTRNSQQWCLFE